QLNLLSLNLLSQNLLKILRKLRRILLMSLFIENLNLIFRIRNEINQQFFSQLMTDIKVQKPVIASIELSFFRNFIILTTMSEF
ncbi:hypothetical protein BDDG_13263, partial [Blastomyces dermatitidis ATCC 18188]